MSDLFTRADAEDLARPTNRAAAKGVPSIAHDDPMPPGPYAVGMTHSSRGDSRPYTIVCGDGRAIAGHVESIACARAIVFALNIVVV